MRKDITKYGEELGINEKFTFEIYNMFFNDYRKLLGVSNKRMLSKTIVEVLSEMSAEYSRLQIILGDHSIGQLLKKANLTYVQSTFLTTSSVLLKTTNTSATQILSYLQSYYRYKENVNVGLFQNVTKALSVFLPYMIGLNRHSYIYLPWKPILEQFISPPPTNITIVYNKLIDARHSNYSMASIFKILSIADSHFEYTPVIHFSPILFHLSVVEIKEKSNLSSSDWNVLKRTTGGDLSWLGFDYLRKTTLEVESLGKDWKVDMFTSTLSSLAMETNLTVAENSLLGILIAYSGQVKQNASVQQFLSERIMANYAPTLNKTKKLNALVTRRFGMYPGSVKESQRKLSSMKIIDLLSKMYKGEDSCYFFYYNFTFLKDSKML